MIVLHEHNHGAMRLQILECDCGRRDCRTVVIIGAIGDKPYWLTLGIVPEETVGQHVAGICERADIQADILRGIALMGVKRGVLVESGRACFEQLQAWLASPTWIDRLPLELVWATRRVVFGNDFSRVVRALVALDGAVPELEEGPVPAPSMEALFERQMRVEYSPENRSRS